MAASLMAVSLLTGCGSSSLVQKGIEQAGVSYNDGSEPLKAQKISGNVGSGKPAAVDPQISGSEKRVPEAGRDSAGRGSG